MLGRRMRATSVIAVTVIVAFAGCIEDAVLVTTSSSGAGGMVGAGASSSSGTQTSSDSGTGGSMIGCDDPGDCPGTDTTCRQRTCDGEVCGFQYTAQNVPCIENNGQVCDGMGDCVECTLDEHCMNEPCVNNVCGLKLPNGDPCASDDECMSGNCPATDLVCCDLPCAGVCESCLAAQTCGVDGTCRDIAAGTDPDMECMQNNVCFGGSCQTGKIVFATSLTYNGNLGGLAGADQKCQTHAMMGCLPSTATFMAWLSTAQDSPSTRFTQSSVPYRRVDGAAVANSWGDLIDGSINVALNLDEKGNPAPNSNIPSGCMQDLAYSGTTTAGLPLMAATNRCSEWTSTTTEGQWGRFGATSGNWTDYCTGNGGGTCGLSAVIYCFEQ